MQINAKPFLLAAIIFESIIISASVNAVLDLDVIGDGFHRSLNYKVDINGLNESNCAISLHVLLPPEIYVNVDEIADLKRLGKALACSVGEIDVELFAEKAKPQNVTICEDLKASKSVLLSLPVHQRYKFSENDGGYVPVNIPYPKLLIGCVKRLKEHRVSGIDICSPCVNLARKWREIPYRMESINKSWEIPVGNLSHLNKVSYVTLLVTGIGAAVVLRSILRLKIRGDSNVVKED